MTRHSELSAIHVPYNWSYADQTAREAATGFLPADVGKLARQLDDNSLWMLTDDDPETWVQIGGGGESELVQVVNTQTGAVATGTTTIPFDDTIPQNTEGTEFMTLAITPTNASNILYIDVVFIASASIAEWITAALFQDAVADALAVAVQYQTTATGGVTISFTYKMTAGTTSATTFKVRGGIPNAGTITFNGQSGSRKFGGVLASSITIKEVLS